MVLKVTLCQQHHLSGSDAEMNAFPNTHFQCFSYKACSFQNAIAFSCFVKMSSLSGRNVSTDLTLTNCLLLAVLSQRATSWKGLGKGPPQLCLDPNPELRTSTLLKDPAFSQGWGNLERSRQPSGLPQAIGGECGGVVKCGCKYAEKEISGFSHPEEINKPEAIENGNFLERAVRNCFLPQS